MKLDEARAKATQGPINAAKDVCQQWYLQHCGHRMAEVYHSTPNYQSATRRAMDTTLLAHYWNTYMGLVEIVTSIRTCVPLVVGSMPDEHAKLLTAVYHAAGAALARAETVEVGE